MNQTNNEISTTKPLCEICKNEIETNPETICINCIQNSIEIEKIILTQRKRISELTEEIKNIEQEKINLLKKIDELENPPQKEETPEYIKQDWWTNLQL